MPVNLHSRWINICGGSIGLLGNYRKIDPSFSIEEGNWRREPQLPSNWIEVCRLCWSVRGEARQCHFMGEDIRFERLQNLITGMLELRRSLECLQLSNVSCCNARLAAKLKNKKWKITWASMNYFRFSFIFHLLGFSLFILTNLLLHKNRHLML